MGAWHLSGMPFENPFTYIVIDDTLPGTKLVFYTQREVRCGLIGMWLSYFAVFESTNDKSLNL